jgi:hypothetical protein
MPCKKKKKRKRKSKNPWLSVRGFEAILQLATLVSVLATQPVCNIARLDSTRDRTDLMHHRSPWIDRRQWESINGGGKPHCRIGPI